MILCKFEMDWADEFCVSGMALLDTAAVNYILANDTNQQKVSWYFGSNEGWDDLPIYQFIERLEFTEISAITAQELNSVWGGKTFGHFPDFEDML